MLSQNLVQGWVKTWSKYVAQQHWTKFWLKKCFLFFFCFARFSLKSYSPCRNNNIFEKQKKQKTEKHWTKFWLKKAILDQVLTLQHICCMRALRFPLATTSFQNYFKKGATLYLQSLIYSAGYTESNCHSACDQWVLWEFRSAMSVRGQTCKCNPFSNCLSTMVNCWNVCCYGI